MSFSIDFDFIKTSWTSFVNGVVLTAVAQHASLKKPRGNARGLLSPSLRNP